MIKVLTLLGTRPEAIKLSRLINLLDTHTSQTIVHTGQNFDYELNQVFFNELEIRKPDYFLEAAGVSSSETIGKVIIRTDEVLNKIKPDVFLILGDTNSALAAISAKKRQIPIFHIEAGNRSFDQRVPEEINRKLVDHISDINLTYSSIAKNYLESEGIYPDRIIKVGSPMKEVISFYYEKIQSSNILEKLEINRGNFFLISSHREENIDSDNNFMKLVELLNFLARTYGLKIIFPVHPRTNNKIKKLKLKLDKKVIKLKPLGFFDYVKLQMNAKVVISDSGTITEESSILNFPAINIRSAHERPEGMEEGAVMMTGLNIDRVHEAIEILQGQPIKKDRLLNIVNDYNVPNFSHKVLRIIISYTDYVNYYVWHKDQK